MPSRNLATLPSEAPRRPGKQPIGQQLAASRSSRVDMEQESEGCGQAALMQNTDVDSLVRTEVNLGMQQIRSIEQQLRIVPQGFLGRTDVSDAQALRMTLMTASATIMGSFGKIMGWLSAHPPNSNSFPNDNFSVSDHDSESPRPRIPSAATSSKQHVMNPTSPLLSPCHTPHSGSGMSEDSPNPASPPLLSDADGDAAAAAGTTTTCAGGGRARRPANEATTSADPEAAKQKSLSVKRKFMPKYNCKQRASDPGHDGPPDDGHTWRKYGQKDILGSRNPRSYYRCTHKIELGCPAIKYVQRCDEDPMVFDVTYRGSHTCQSIHQHIPAWPFSFPEQMAIALNRVHQLPPSDPTHASAIANYPNLGRHLVNSSAAQSQLSSSNELLLGGNRHGFSQLASGLPMGGVGVASTAGILDTPRFSLNPTPSMELGVHQPGHQQDFSVKPEDNNPSESRGIDVSRLPRSDMFSGDLLNMLLANSRAGQNDISFTLGEDDLQSEMKRVKLQQQHMELAGSTSDNSGHVDKSAESPYGTRWGAELDVDYQLEEQISSRYDSNSSIISESAQSRPGLANNQTTSAERGGIASIKESDNSVETTVSSLGVMPVFSIDGMEYELQYPGSQPFLC
ncbi:unnamed protein product [Calypogeia fissa]